jgi:hypothetical protein
VIVDATHRGWMLGTAGLLVAAAAAYGLASRSAPGGVTGDSAAGLAFGIAAAGLMVFEGLLAARKRKRAWRLGRAATWMRGHIWLGVLAVPLVLFHSGFHAGGAITTILLALFGLVTLSGLFGLALQQVLPRVMTARVEMETVYEQIPLVVVQLRKEAAERAGKTGDPVIAKVHHEAIEPFLVSDGGRAQRLGDAGRSEAMFAELKRLVPPAHHETLADLAHICEERRQLALQARLHRWLHGWLLVHVPVSYALLLLVAAHAVMTLLY